MFTLDELVYAIPLAWNPETSGKPEGTHPADGQDLVSALLVYRYCGGVILHCEVGGEYRRDPHYLNELDGGVRVDLTAGRFRKQSPMRKFKKKDSKDPQDVLDRVDILESRVEDVLAWR